MAFSPLSFALGMGVAYFTPILSRTFRPLAVEATAMGLGLIDDLRRIAAEQIENLEDIAAEARARREEIAATPLMDEGEGEEAGLDPSVGNGEGPPEASPNGTRVRRRAASRSRSRPA